MEGWFPVIVAAVWAVLLGGLGGALTTIGAWYRDLTKPAWQPPDWLFGPAWTVILGLAAWAGVLCWHAASTAAQRADVLIVYAVNFVFHFAWSPIFFTFRRPDLALIEVVFLWASIVAMIIVAAALSTTAVLALLPYLLWVSFAAFLNRTIVGLNRPFA